MSRAIVVDTSAIVAIIEAEPEAPAFELALEQAQTKTVAAPSVIEAMMVLSRKRGADSANVVMGMLRAFEIQVVAFDEHFIPVAFNAFLRFGKGRHPAGLNFGDCFSYALAHSRGEPLLFKGQDFSATDLISVVRQDVR